MALYAANGSINISVRDGSTYTGLYANDGSINVVVSDGVGIKGMYHPCGAWWVTVAPGGLLPLHAPDGSIYVQEAPFSQNHGLMVTVVSGSLETEPGDGTGYAREWYWWT